MCGWWLPLPLMWLMWLPSSPPRYRFDAFASALSPQPLPPPSPLLLPLLLLCLSPLPLRITCVMYYHIRFCDHIALIHRWIEWVKRPLRQPTADAGGCGYLTSGPRRAGKDIDNGWPRFNDNRAAPSEVHMKTKTQSSSQPHNIDPQTPASLHARSGTGRSGL